MCETTCNYTGIPFANILYSTDSFITTEYLKIVAAKSKVVLCEGTSRIQYNKGDIVWAQAAGGTGQHGVGTDPIIEYYLSFGKKFTFYVFSVYYFF
jgi:hypothetical protein